MPTYKPIGKIINAPSVLPGTLTPAKLTATSWELALVRGTAVFNDTVIPSVAIKVWESTAPTTGNPHYVTFTDAKGVYGVTVRAYVKITLKIN